MPEVPPNAVRRETADYIGYSPQGYQEERRLNTRVNTVVDLSGVGIS